MKIHIIYINHETETLESKDYDTDNLNIFLKEMYKKYGEYFYTNIEDAEKELDKLYPIWDLK